MPKSHRSNVCFAVILAFLVLAPVLSLIAPEVKAQTRAGGSVMVYPDAQVPLYGSIGHNWTFTFQARYRYNQTDEPIFNATVEIEVTNAEGKPVHTFDCNTSQGTFAFNYTSNVPAILTFTPTKLVTQDKTEWRLTQPEKNMITPYISIKVYWDTFSVALVNSTTNDLGAADVWVKVTRLLVPTGTAASYDGVNSIALIRGEVDDANVTINGVVAHKTSEAGVYAANITAAFPTAYTLVTVAEDNWKTTQTAFAIPHSANLKVWLIAAAAAASSVGVVFLAFKLKALRTNKCSKCPFLGGLFLLFTALISLYWAALGFEAALHGFGWLLFAALETGCFLIGTVCASFAFTKKNQATVTFSVTILLVVNTIVAMSSLGAYELPTPWLFVGSAILCAALGAFFVSNADGEFAKTKNAK